MLDIHVFWIYRKPRSTDRNFNFISTLIGEPIDCCDVPGGKFDMARGSMHGGFLKWSVIAMTISKGLAVYASYLFGRKMIGIR